MRIPFTKMEGAGNDYVYVDAIRDTFPVSRAPDLSQAWSDRHFGIGADGLILLLPSARANVRMAMWNADGSRGAMCGNGLRCLAALAHAHGHVANRTFVVETDAGLRAVELLSEPVPGAPWVGIAVRAQLGEVSTGARTSVSVSGTTVEYVPGFAGNPHAVVFVPDVESAPVAALGSAMQQLACFPGGVNVEFVQVVSTAVLRQRTYERGSGETLACGTGAAVASMAARQLGHVIGNEVEVRLRGGRLRVVLDGSSLAIEGPARTVFEGEIDLPD